MKAKSIIFLYLIVVMAVFYGCSDSQPPESAPDPVGSCIDEDSDGYGENCAAGTDCDDGNAMIYRQANLYPDLDGDGFGVDHITSVCIGAGIPAGWAQNNTDCNDSNEDIHPSATEITDDDIDNDCDGEIDETLSTCATISQFGITSKFDQAYACGQFANGDYWVQGPIQITHIDPPVQTQNGLTVNGAMIDPDPADFPSDVNQHQGYGETVYEYDPAYNDALPNGQAVSDANPIHVNTGSNIISTISTPGTNANDPYNTHLRTAAILTVLDGIPPDNSFRPGYCAASKSVRFNESDLDYSLLQRFAIDNNILDAMLSDFDICSRSTPATARDSLNNVAAFFERPWLDHIPLAVGRSHHPLDNMPEYGRNISIHIGIGAAMLQMDFNNEEKRDLLVRYAQLGIDLYSVCTRPGGNDRWSGSGGQSSGRKWPILFAGMILNDTTGMSSIGQLSGDYAQTNGVFNTTLPDDYIHFGEDDQTFFVSQEEIIAHTPYSHDPENYEPPSEGNLDDPDYNPPPEYRDNQGPQRFYPYRQADLALPEYGPAHWSFSTGMIGLDSKYWHNGYRHVNSPAWTGFIFAAKAMNAETLWHHDALFDYVDRFVGIEQVEPHASRFIRAVWEAYRASCGPVWNGQ